MTEPTKANMMLFGDLLTLSMPGRSREEVAAAFDNIFKQAEERKNYYGPVPPDYPPDYPHEPHIQTTDSEEGA